MCRHQNPRHPIPTNPTDGFLLPLSNTAHRRDAIRRAASAHDVVEQTIARLAVDLRLGIKKQQQQQQRQQVPLQTLQQQLQAALGETRSTTRQPRATTRRLMVAVIRDFARVNIDPGPPFWQAVTEWLAPPAVALSTAELASLTLALATLDVPEGSEALLDAVLQAVCTHKKTPPQHLSVAEGNQLRKALTLLQGPGGSFRAGPGPSMSWLLALLQATEKAAAAAAAGATADVRPLTARSSSSNSLVRRPAAVVAPPEATKRETALTSSALHRRVLDALTTLGFASESEVKHAGLNLDVVLYPPPPSSSSPQKPLVIEIDGPQHFIQGDPTRPTGDTAARRRLIRSQHDVWAGLVVITYADEQLQQQGGGGGTTPTTPQARLVALMEDKVQEQAGVSLATYRISGGREKEEEEGEWRVAKRLFLSASPEALLEVVREEEEKMDAMHWATALTRMARFIQHNHRHHNHKKTKISSSSSSSTASYERYLGPDGVLRDEAQAQTLLREAPFPALALLLDALSDYYTKQQEKEEDARALASLAVTRAHEDSSSTIHTSHSLVLFLRALARLGYQSPVQLPLSPTLLQTKAQQGQLEAPALASVLDSLATILLPTSSSSSCMEGNESIASTLLTLLESAEGKLHLLKPRNLVTFVGAFSLFQQAGLVVPEEERLITAIVAAAGKPHVCQSLSLGDLALLTYREPAAEEGKGEEIINQRERRKAPQWPLVGEVRRRLRALTPAELFTFVQEGMGGGGRGGRRRRPLPTRAFLVMLTNEVYKQRAGFTARERTMVVARLKDWEEIHDPGPRFWQRLS